MKFNSVASSVLFAKVVTKKRPYSDEILSLRILVSDNPKVSERTSIYFRNLPETTEPQMIQANIESIRKLLNYSTVVIAE
jgi:hypothetical protein